MDRILASDGASTARPHFKIEKTPDDTYRVFIAVARFSADENSVEVKENALIIAAGKNFANEGKIYLYCSIANRNFEKRFQLVPSCAY